MSTVQSIVRSSRNMAEKFSGRWKMAKTTGGRTVAETALTARGSDSVYDD